MSSVEFVVIATVHDHHFGQRPSELFFDHELTEHFRLDAVVQPVVVRVVFGAWQEGGLARLAVEQTGVVRPLSELLRRHRLVRNFEVLGHFEGDRALRVDFISDWRITLLGIEADPSVEVQALGAQLVHILSVHLPAAGLPLVSPLPAASVFGVVYELFFDGLGSFNVELAVRIF